MLTAHPPPFVINTRIWCRIATGRRGNQMTNDDLGHCSSLWYILWTQPQHHYVTAETRPQHDDHQMTMDDSKHDGSEWANQTTNDDSGRHSSFIVCDSHKRQWCATTTQRQYRTTTQQQGHERRARRWAHTPTTPSPSLTAHHSQVNIPFLHTPWQIFLSELPILMRLAG